MSTPMYSAWFLVSLVSFPLVFGAGHQLGDTMCLLPVVVTMMSAWPTTSELG